MGIPVKTGEWDLGTARRKAAGVGAGQETTTLAMAAERLIYSRGKVGEKTSTRTVPWSRSTRRPVSLWY